MKKITKKPNWFDLEKYEKCRELDAHDWYIQLRARGVAYSRVYHSIKANHLIDKKEDEITSQLISMFIEDCIVQQDFLNYPDISGLKHAN